MGVDMCVFASLAVCMVSMKVSAHSKCLQIDETKHFGKLLLCVM